MELAMSALDILADVRHVLLDMDGTICEGGRLYDCTKPFLQMLDERKIGHTFLTNNSSRSVDAHVRHFAAMGLRISREELYTSTLNAADYLSKKLPGARRLFSLGTESMRLELSRLGFEDVDESPDAVLVGFDNEPVYARLCTAGHWIAQGRPFLSTHPDRLCPSDQPTLLIDCGCITACLERATGKQSVILGKPSPAMLNAAIAAVGVKPWQTLMVGDRLDTDIAMANASGARSAHINPTGHCSSAGRDGCEPDLVVRNLGELSDLFSQLHNKK